MTANPNAVAAAKVAYDAGFRGAALVNAVALAGAESNWNPNSLNDNPSTGDYSVGFWQINYFDSLRAPRTAAFGDPGSLRGTNPTGNEAHANAKAAYALSGGGASWSPWKADFNNGRYYQYLPAAKDAVDQIMGGATMVGAVGSPYQYATSTGVAPVANASTGAGVDTGSQTIQADNCLIHPTLKLPSILPDLDFCLLSTNTARAVGGALILGSGVIVGLIGVALLTGQTKMVSNVLSVVPNPAAQGFARFGSAARQARDDDKLEAQTNREIDEGSRATPEQQQQHYEQEMARRSHTGPNTRRLRVVNDAA